MDRDKTIEVEAAAFRRLLAHLDTRTDAQNIDLMNLAGFCRNCLSKWYAAAAEERGHSVTYEDAREPGNGRRSFRRRRPLNNWRPFKPARTRRRAHDPAR